MVTLDKHQLSSDTKVLHLNQISQSAEADCTYLDMFVHELRVRAIVDTGAPFCIVSTKFTNRLRLPPNLVHHKQYGTAGEHTTTSCGAYSALPFQFGSIVVSSPAVVLPNQSYKMIISTSFLKEYGVKICHSSHTFNICGQSLPLVYSRTGLPHSKPQFFNVVFSDNVVPIHYCTREKHYRNSPSQIPEHRGFPLRLYALSVYRQVTKLF